MLPLTKPSFVFIIIVVIFIIILWRYYCTSYASFLNFFKNSGLGFFVEIKKVKKWEVLPNNTKKGNELLAR